MTWLRSEEEVDAMIQKLIDNTKGIYITQGVSFNKNKPKQLELLKFALMSSYSFGGYMKELITEKYHESNWVSVQIINKQNNNDNMNKMIEVESESVLNNIKEIKEPKKQFENIPKVDDGVDIKPKKRNIADFV